MKKEKKNCIIIREGLMYVSMNVCVHLCKQTPPRPFDQFTSCLVEK